jgi:uncharacterized protein YegJ (DUF2314 family)
MKKRMRLRATIAVLSASVTVVLADPAADKPVLVASADSEMNAAIAHAQETLDAFLGIAAHPPTGASDFKLKVRVTDSHGTEHLWITPFSVTASGFSGVVADTPDYVTSVAYGQVIHFPRKEITDWGYVLAGKQKGSFTICVLFKRMPKDEVEQYRRDYGFEC